MDKDLSDKQPFHGDIPPTLQRALDSTSNTSVWSTHQSSLNDLGVPQASHDHPNGDANKTPVAYPPPPQPSEAAELPHNRCIGILPLLPQGVGVGANLLQNSNQARLPPHSRSTGAPPAQSTSVPISLPTNTFGSACRPLDRSRAPKVKVCLLSAGNGLPALKDASLIMGELDGIRGIDHENVISRTSKAIDIALDRFFELDIHEGGIFILIISGHGCLAGDRMNLEFKTGNGIIVSSEMLEEKIRSLPEHCTIEIIVDTCYAERLVPGLRRIANPSAPSLMPVDHGAPLPTISHTPLSGSRQNTMQSVFNHSATRPDGGLSDTWSLFEQIQPKYKANVVVWAASEAYGSAYSEEDLPEKLGVYSIMVGAIFSAFGSKGRKVTRQEIWEDVWNIVEKHNNTRRERDSRKPPEKREILSMKSRIQRPVLLTSVESPERVLNGRMFQPISKGR